MHTGSRLEQTLFRLQSQHACIGYLSRELRGRPGIVAELGLGFGRTFDHLRRNLPDHEIYGFDRENTTLPDACPAPEYLVLGEISETFPAFAARFAGQVVLVNSDIGSYNIAERGPKARMISKVVPPAIAPGGYIMSDLPLELPAGFHRIPLPPGAHEGSYHLYRRSD